MKRLLIAPVLIVLLARCEPYQPPAQTRGTTDAGTVKVERVWNHPTAGIAYILVRYTNTTRETFTSVNVSCDYYGQDGQVKSTNDAGWYKHEVGSIPPGFTRTLELGRIHYDQWRVARAECRVNWARR